MTTTKEPTMTTAEIVAPFLAAAKARDKALGLSVRCPVCDAGIGKFCLKGMDKRTHVEVIHRTADQIIRHRERVALADSR